MRLLLDTHALLWWWSDDPRLSERARAAITGADPVYVSAVSAWEIATAVRLGRLPELTKASTEFSELVASDGFSHLPISHVHAQWAGRYSQNHRDPFDRMLAAQAELEGMTLVSRDRAFEDFGTHRLW